MPCPSGHMGPAHHAVHCAELASHTACAANGGACTPVSIGISVGTWDGANGCACGFSPCMVGSRWFDPDPDPPTATPPARCGPSGEGGAKTYGGGPFPYMARMRELHVACCRAAHALPRTAHSISSTRTATHTEKRRACDRIPWRLHAAVAVSIIRRSRRRRRRTRDARVPRITYRGAPATA